MTKNNQTRAIKLKKSYSYTTYQFYGCMNNKNTTSIDGLKIAALTCLSWIRDRLEENDIFTELILPTEENFKKVKEEDFKSISINNGYTLDVISDFKEGIWAIRIIESDRGTVNDEPVVGRIIQSDIAFRIINDELHCGFKTTVSDIEGTKRARAYRFSPVTRLYKNPNFGLKQIINIDTRSDNKLDSSYKISQLKELYDNNDNQLPIVIFIEDVNTLLIKALEPTNTISKSLLSNKTIKIKTDIDDKTDNVKINPIESFEHYVSYMFSMWNMGYCRTYILPSTELKHFCSIFKCYFVNDGKLICIEPKKYGGSIIIFQDDQDEKFIKHTNEWHFNRHVDFKDVMFVSEADQFLMHKKQESYQKVQRELDGLQEKINALQNRNYREMRKEEYEQERHQTINELNNNIDDLRKSVNEEINKNAELMKDKTVLKKQLFDCKSYCDYLTRKSNRPKSHKDIASWVKTHFVNIVLHDKAIDLLNQNNATRVSIDNICNALDFLATLYYRYLFDELSEQDMMDSCSKIYDRPYEVTPSGIPNNLAILDAYCKIRYELDGIRKEYVLEQHLKVGGSFDKDLLRIYFIVDKQRQKIVIGALPNHLNY